MPTQQGFDTTGLALQIKLRLVMQLELLARQSLAQRVFDLAPAQGAGGHDRIETREGVLARTFCPVHRGVRMLQERRGVHAVVRVIRNADAGGDINLVVLELEWRLKQIQHSLGNFGGIAGGFQVRQQQRELITTDSGERVTAANATAQPVRDAAQQFVANRMSERVVHLLEPVQVNEQERNAFLAPRCSGNGKPEPFVQQSPVWQLGQGVMLRLKRDLCRHLPVLHADRAEALRHLEQFVIVFFGLFDLAEGPADHA